MDDLIKRADAIEALSRSSVYAWSTEQDQTAHNWALNIIKELPSAEAGHGKWQRFNDEYGTYWTGCSNCKGDIPKDKYGVDIYTDFCPNCGAMMKGGAE